MPVCSISFSPGAASEGGPVAVRFEGDWVRVGKEEDEIAPLLVERNLKVERGVGGMGVGSQLVSGLSLSGRGGAAAAREV